MMGRNKKYTHEKRESSLLYFSPLLREGVRCLMEYASLYKRRIQWWSHSNTVVLLQTNRVKYSLFQERSGGTLSEFKVSGSLHRLRKKN